MSVRTRSFARHDGKEVVEATLESAEGVTVAVLNYGATLRDWRVPDSRGRPLPVILGFEELDAYVGHQWYFGAVVGRVANRIARGRFGLDGTTHRLARNDGPNHLHGGVVGLDRRLWTLDTDTDANAVRFAYDSPDGEEGYPGRVRFEVVYRLDGHRLTCEMTGRPDRPTPINLAHHAYYNLAGGGDVLDHELTIRADRFTPLDGTQIPTGAIEPVAGTRYDFRAPRTFRDDAGAPVPCDINLVLDEGRDPAAPAAELGCQTSGLHLRLWADQPGLQLFNAPAIDLETPGLDGSRYGPYCGLCLEPQHFPDSPNQPDFPSIICTPDAPYRQKLGVEIGPEGGRVSGSATAELSLYLIG